MNTKTAKLTAWDRIMMAITFAEADEAETARELLDNRLGENRAEQRPRKEADSRPELHV